MHFLALVQFFSLHTLLYFSTASIESQVFASLREDHASQQIHPSTLCSIFTIIFRIIVTIPLSGAIGQTSNLLGCTSRWRISGINRRKWARRCHNLQDYNHHCNSSTCHKNYHRDGHRRKYRLHNLHPNCPTVRNSSDNSGDSHPSRSHDHQDRIFDHRCKRIPRHKHNHCISKLEFDHSNDIGFSRNVFFLYRNIPVLLLNILTFIRRWPMAYILSSLECLQHVDHITSCYANIS